MDQALLASTDGLRQRPVLVDGNFASLWPGELDLAPDAMYDEIKANGHWVDDDRARVSVSEWK